MSGAARPSRRGMGTFSPSHHNVLSEPLAQGMPLGVDLTEANVPRVPITSASPGPRLRESPPNGNSSPETFQPASELPELAQRPTPRRRSPEAANDISPRRSPVRSPVVMVDSHVDATDGLATDEESNLREAVHRLDVDNVALRAEVATLRHENYYMKEVSRSRVQQPQPVLASQTSFTIPAPTILRTAPAPEERRVSISTGAADRANVVSTAESVRMGAKLRAAEEAHARAEERIVTMRGELESKAGELQRARDELDSSRFEVVALREELQAARAITELERKEHEKRERNEVDALRRELQEATSMAEEAIRNVRSTTEELVATKDELYLARDRIAAMEENGAQSSRNNAVSRFPRQAMAGPSPSVRYDGAMAYSRDAASSVPIGSRDAEAVERGRALERFLQTDRAF